MSGRKGRFSRERLRYGALSTAVLAVLLALLTGLCVLADTLETRLGWRRDLSFNGITTQSETTLAVLDSLEHPVHIYALFSRGQEDQPLMELLARYSAASGKVTWEQADIAMNPGLLTKFAGNSSENVITTDSLIVSCEETGRFRVLPYTDFLSFSLDEESGGYRVSGITYENAITSAIRYAARDEVPRAVMLQGHGELEESAAAALSSLLEQNGFDPVWTTLADAALEPGDLLVLLSPVRDLTEAELEQVTAFTGKGGSILFTCDFTDPLSDMPHYAALLRSYGFLARDGLVIASAEEKDSYYSDNRICLIPTMQSTEITADLVEAGADTLLLAGSRGFELPGETDNNLSVSAVLVSGARAYLRSISNVSSSLEQGDSDEPGPFALALQARRITREGYVSRAFVLGCSTLLTSTDVWAMTDAQEFIVRVVEYLLDTAPMSLGIMAKSAVRPQLSVRSITLGTLVTVLLPLLTAAAAVIVLTRRRNR